MPSQDKHEVSLAEPADSGAKASTAPRFISLSEALGGHRNSLGLLRLILAALVIFDHAFPLGGFGADPFWNLTKGQASLGSIAVLGFFAISGYLIAKSAASADFVQFMWRRTLRIFPAYWLVLLVTAFLVGPVIWVSGGQPLITYFTLAGDGPVGYVAKNFTLQIGTYGIYDLLAGTTPYGQEVGGSVFNGSLWTLIYEWQSYIIVGVLGLFGVLTRARAVVPLLTAFVGAMLIMSMVSWDALTAFVPVMADRQFLTLTFTFLVGSTLAVYSRQIPFDHKLGIFAGILVLLTLRWGGFAIVGTVAGAYFLFWLAAFLPAKVQWIGAKNDYSYGVYIYGFLAQQVLAFYGAHKLGYVPYVIFALVLAFGCAWLSWHLVEKRAMSLKNWGPGVGIRHWYERARMRFPARTSED